MQPFTKHTGIVAVLDRANVDTDQIIPKQFLKRVERTGFGEFLFFDWRYHEDGSVCPGFELNAPGYKGASILLAGKNFGSGSSREHAPWALLDYGFRAIIAPSFADIFYNNCFKNGILPVVLPEPVVGALMAKAKAHPGWTLTVDLRKALTHFGRDAGCTISEAYYYTGADMQTKGRDGAFHEYLMYSGYTVRTKAIKQMIDDATGELVEKANLDIELVIDMFNTIGLYETCILMSGDSDFERALELVRTKGKRIAVVAHPDMTARELRNVAGRNFFDLRDLEKSIARTDRLPDATVSGAILNDMEEAIGAPPTAV